MFSRLKKLEAAYRRYPESPLFARLADAYLTRGRAEEALELCEEGCERFPEYPTGFQVLGKCYQANGQFEEARSALDRALRLDPGNPGGFRQLCEIYRELGVTTLALKSAQQALHYDPLNADLVSLADRLQYDVRLQATAPQEPRAVVDESRTPPAEPVEARPVTTLPAGSLVEEAVLPDEEVEDGGARADLAALGVEILGAPVAPKADEGSDASAEDLSADQDAAPVILPEVTEENSLAAEDGASGIDSLEIVLPSDPVDIVLPGAVGGDESVAEEPAADLSDGIVLPTDVFETEAAVVGETVEENADVLQIQDAADGIDEDAEDPAEATDASVFAPVEVAGAADSEDPAEAAKTFSPAEDPADEIVLPTDTDESGLGIVVPPEDGHISSDRSADTTRRWPEVAPLTLKVVRDKVVSDPAEAERQTPDEPEKRDADAVEQASGQSADAGADETSDTMLSSGPGLSWVDMPDPDEASTVENYPVAGSAEDEPEEEGETLSRELPAEGQGGPESLVATEADPERGEDEVVAEDLLVDAVPGPVAEDEEEDSVPSESSLATDLAAAAAAVVPEIEGTPAWVSAAAEAVAAEAVSVEADLTEPAEESPVEADLTEPAEESPVETDLAESAEESPVEADVSPENGATASVEAEPASADVVEPLAADVAVPVADSVEADVSPQDEATPEENRYLAELQVAADIADMMGRETEATSADELRQLAELAAPEGAELAPEATAPGEPAAESSPEAADPVAPATEGTMPGAAEMADPGTPEGEMPYDFDEAGVPAEGEVYNRPTGLAARDDGELMRLFQEIESERQGQASQPDPPAAPDPDRAASAAGEEVVLPLAGALPGSRIATVTLAEIYSSQGLVQRAIDTYRRILEQDPGNEEIKAQLAALENRA